MAQWPQFLKIQFHLNNKKEEYSFNTAIPDNQQYSSLITLQMVIKVRLIKPKKRQSHSFYKTSEIKFQTLSNPSLNKFRMRSTQKLIHFRNPWEQLDKQQINQLAERLQDRPEDLYGAVKQNIFQRKQATRLKFNRLSINLEKISKTPIQKNPLKINDMIEANQFSKIQRAMRKGFISIEDKLNQSKLMNKIKQKRKEYERQMKNIINDKRLILETDLPKINRIKAVNKPNHEVLGRDSKGKLPVWKMR